MGHCHVATTVRIAHARVQENGEMQKELRNIDGCITENNGVPDDRIEVSCYWARMLIL